MINLVDFSFCLNKDTWIVQRHLPSVLDEDMWCSQVYSIVNMKYIFLVWHVLTCLLICGKFLSCTASQLQGEANLTSMQQHSVRSSSGKFNCYSIYAQVYIIINIFLHNFLRSCCAQVVSLTMTDVCLRVGLQGPLDKHRWHPYCLILQIHHHQVEIVYIHFD